MSLHKPITKNILQSNDRLITLWFHARGDERSPGLVELYLFYKVGSPERQCNQQTADFQLLAQKRKTLIAGAHS